ncbi:hypothetical protein GNI_183710 [Gregarina niphandrodes]|uniref:Uncharacterized protein n=1 Tax=Gregarina niphandrodes TaxID=110365 RepID=A0A023AX59_GRENI|nr:hypothetical protein GNI_183710 [Gregarina niphandrodes]EZG43182.1 hypothetical protein GNI_183710 [Gregarina niphandrodes]|eukprot:XP_011133561.1 hypothetical protein GNI_183710 [Gregarina niphandrodes]
MLVKGGTERGSNKAAYRGNVIRALTSLAVMAKTFRNEDNALTEIEKLLSGDEWVRVKCIREKDLSECQLIYVELGTIISLFVTSPFGDVSEKAQETVSRLLQGVGGRRLRNHWIAGCLLQRAGVSTKKLIDFIVDTLGYIPAARTTAFEFLTKRDVPYSRYVLRPTTTDRKKMLLAREKLLPMTKITARDFAKRIYPVTNIATSAIKYIATKPRNSPPPAMPVGVYYPRCSAVDVDSAAFESVREKLSGDYQKEILSGRRVPQYRFDVCSLDYVEFGALLENYTQHAFGAVGSEIFRKIADLMEERYSSWRVRAWVSGCLLQDAEKPIPWLLDLCLQDLNYVPPTSWRLECLKARNELYKWRNRLKPANPKMRFYELVGGLNEKISIPEFKRLAAMSGKKQKEFLCEKYHSYSKSTRALGCTPPAATKLAPSPSAPSQPAQIPKQEKPAGNSSSRTVEPSGPAATLSPAMMYCHPNDLIEFLDRVESNIQDPLMRV